METQPAIKSYFFGKGYQDLNNTIKDSWKSNENAYENYFDDSSTADTWVGKIFYFFAALSVVIFGTISFSILSIVHVLFLFTVFTVIYILFTIVWSIDSIYRNINKIFSACPNCYSKSKLPVYHCPKCNNEHTQLWPSEYGILKRTCKCGTKLPTTFFNGRNSLNATCSVCNNRIETLEARPIAVPIVGAPSVGKSFFVYSMIYEIKENLCNNGDFKFSFMNSFNKTNYDSQINMLNARTPLRKTTENNPVASNFFLEKNSKKFIFYIYDSAGEAFASTRNLVHHKFYDYFHGMIFIIDPFSIPCISNRYSKQLSASSNIRPSNYPLGDVYDALLLNLEKNYGYKATRQIKKPVLIILSKLDAFDLDNKIGLETAKKLMKMEDAIKNEDEAMDKLCRQYLKNNEMETILNKIEWKFPNAKFFAVSSNGDSSIGIDSATKWFLKSINSNFSFSEGK